MTIYNMIWFGTGVYAAGEVYRKRQNVWQNIGVAKRIHTEVRWRHFLLSFAGCRVEGLPDVQSDTICSPLFSALVSIFKPKEFMLHNAKKGVSVWNSLNSRL
jgi:hypothetical protein